MVWWLIMLFYLCVIYLVFIVLLWIFSILCWRLNPPIIAENPIFERLKTHFKIVKIKNNLYYYKGLWLDENCIYFQGSKMQHFNNVNFLFLFMRTI